MDRCIAMLNNQLEYPFPLLEGRSSFRWGENM